MLFEERTARQYEQEKQGDQRQPFQVDRDRLIYSSAFSRLTQVTQVVSASEGSVFHNRLTHSLKVAQVARRLAERLLRGPLCGKLDAYGGLDPDVVEAAALAHDLGHPPFGHIAEKELNKIARQNQLEDGFEGNAQTFRILTCLEPHRLDYQGLNLTRATLNATLKYPWLCVRNSDDPQSRKRSKKYSVYDLDIESFKFARATFEGGISNDKQTIEASIMDFADDVTFSIHDLEDFYVAGLIPVDMLLYSTDEFNRFIKTWLKHEPDDEIKNQVEGKNQQDSFKRLLKAYTSVSNGCPVGSIEHISHIKRVSSNLIQRFIQAVDLRADYGKHGFLERKESQELDLRLLQQLVRNYVIYNPRLATQQKGQKKVIRDLFEVYKEAVNSNDVNLIPVRFLKNGSLEELIKNGDEPKHKTRIAIDIVASFTEIEAKFMYHRLAGINWGSVMDYVG